ncbi:MAG: ester cyclase [Ignavibacteriales bacterium]|nr:ester cyclase [Ignavibacteriales bacterium]
MKPSEIVNEFMTAIEKNDFKKAESLVSNDMVVEGITPTPLNSTEFLGTHRALNSGLPDFRFNHKIIKETPDNVDITVRLTGTHSKDMMPPIPGLGTIRATNKQVKMPEEKIGIKVKNNKITKVNLQSVPGGGLPGLLKQIGVDIHAHA